MLLCAEMTREELFISIRKRDSYGSDKTRGYLKEALVGVLDETLKTVPRDIRMRTKYS